MGDYSATWTSRCGPKLVQNRFCQVHSSRAGLLVIWRYIWHCDIAIDINVHGWLCLVFSCYVGLIFSCCSGDWILHLPWSVLDVLDLGCLPSLLHWHFLHVPRLLCAFAVDDHEFASIALVAHEHSCLPKTLSLASRPGNGSLLKCMTSANSKPNI